MLADILGMPSDGKKSPNQFLGKNNAGPSAKRTTIILDKEEREYIDSLIRECKEPGIKPLFSKMLDV
jgi:hypothetical protein